jgi:predicted DNA-binding transcriptional regulator AlpA
MTDTRISPDLLTTPEVSAIVRAPVATLRYWRMIGMGPRSVKLGRRVLYERADVLAWIESERARQNVAS